MKKFIYGLIAAIAICIGVQSCERVAPNYEGVLMTNYGKNGKSDFTLQKGRVNTSMPGTELFQVPLWEQRVTFAQNPDENMRVLHLKCADNTEVTSHPVYSFKVIEDRAVDVVFENKQLDPEGDKFMATLEANILDLKIYDIMKKESREWTTDSLMANGGQLRFEKIMEDIITKEFKLKGLELKTFSCQLDFSDKVKERIDTRNQVNTNVTVIDQQIIEQKKKNELAALKADENRILSLGLTPQVLTKEFLDKWNGSSPLYGNPMQFMKNVAETK